MSLFEEYEEWSVEGVVEAETNAKWCLFKILSDAEDRRGVLDLYSFDEGIRNEILEKWLAVIEETMTTATTIRGE
jgi:hypothetical protein